MNKDDTKLMKTKDTKEIENEQEKGDDELKTKTGKEEPIVEKVAGSTKDDTKGDGLSAGTTGKTGTTKTATQVNPITPDQVTKVKEYGETKKDSEIAKVDANKITILSTILEGRNASLPSSSLTDRSPLEILLDRGTYKFGTELVITPFDVCDGIPRMFELIVTSNPDQDPNVKNQRFDAMVSVLNQVKESAAMFNTNTLTVRVKLRDEINGVKIGDLNVIEEGTIRLQQVESHYDNLQSYASFMESRFMKMVKLFQAFYFKIYSIPQKITVANILSDNPMIRDLSTMAFWEGGYPHIYLSVFQADPIWYREALINLYGQAPMLLGETGVEARNGFKESSRVRAVTDQYASYLVNVNTDKLKSSQLSEYQWLNRLRANMFRHDEVKVRLTRDETILSLLYNPSSVEWTNVQTFIMVNPLIRNGIFDAYSTLLATTNRFTLHRLNDVWNNLDGPTDRIGAQIDESFKSFAAVGNAESPTNMILYETFSDWFEFTLKMPQIPPDYPAVIEIMSIMFFMKMFPALSQQVIHELGYRLSCLFRIYLPTQYREFIERYGEIRYNGQKQPMRSYILTKAQSQMGYIYAIFDATVGTDQNQKSIPKLAPIFAKMRRLLHPKLIEVPLDKKEQAGYPYFSDYSTYMSWPYKSVESYLESDSSEFSDELANIIDLGSQIFRMKSEPHVRQADMMPRATQQYVTLFFNKLSRLIPSASVPIQTTMYKFQDLIKNSGPFVYDRYDPTNFFYVPKTLVLASEDPLRKSQGIPLKKGRRVLIDPYIALRYALTLDGDWKRNIQLVTMGNPSSSDVYVQPSRNYLMVKGDIIDGWMTQLIKPALSFGTAMQLLRWLVLPEDETNPIVEVARSFKLFWRMACWVPFVKRLFENFGLDWATYFLDHFLTNQGVQDGRQVILRICELDPKSLLPIREVNDNSMFGKELEYVDGDTRDMISELSRMLLSYESPLLNMVKGIYLGRFMFTEMKPQQRDVEDGWTHIDFESMVNGKLRQNVLFTQKILKQGNANAVTFRLPQGDRTYFLPYDNNIDKERFMIHLKDFSQIPMGFKESVAKAVHWGWLSFHASEVRINVNIVDTSSKTIDYSDYKTVDALLRVVSTPTAELISTEMVTTMYTTNFTQNAIVIPAYVQWIVTQDNPDKNLHAAVINSGPSRREETVLPDPDELGFGTPYNDRVSLSPSGKNKLRLNKVNWNNEYTAISTRLVDWNVEVDYIPAQPMSYEVFQQYSGA